MHIRRAALAALAALAINHATALDLASAVGGDRLFIARAQIADRQWAAAIDELKRIDAPGNADWNNLMGYSLRKAATPDYAAAERYYDAALRIDPQHRGALHYSGELYLATGDVAKAEQRLTALLHACTVPCPEYSALQRAIAEHKSAGNRPLAAQ